MSQAMNQKAVKKKKNKKPNKSNRSSGLPVVEEEVLEEELTFGDRLLAKITPYLGTIVFAMIAGFLGFAIVAFLMRSNADTKAFEWRELSNASSIARQTGNISEWTRVAETYPNTKAGLWASQFAGDFQLREGLSTLATDQKAGFGMIEKSKSSFQAIIDAPANAKTPTLEQRSHFSLAYACESLGEFEESKKLYGKLIEEAPESAFAGHARRGLTRSSSADFTDLYAKFTNWEQEEIGTAPGPKVPERPSIDFPEVDLPPGVKPPTTSGVVPVVEGGDAVEVVAEEKATAVEKKTEAVTTEAAKVIAETKSAGTAVIEKVAQPVVTETTEVVAEAAAKAAPVVENAKEAVKEAVQEALEATK